MQYVFNRYGRERAALTAVVICYRGRSAVRDVGKALGLPPDQVDELAAAWIAGAATRRCPSACANAASIRTAPVLRRVLA